MPTEAAAAETMGLSKILVAMVFAGSARNIRAFGKLRQGATNLVVIAMEGEAGETKLVGVSLVIAGMASNFTPPELAEEFATFKDAALSPHPELSDTVVRTAKGFASWLNDQDALKRLSTEYELAYEQMWAIFSVDSIHAAWGESDGTKRAEHVVDAMVYVGLASYRVFGERLLDQVVGVFTGALK